MNNTQPKVNTVILSSIRMRKAFKRYLTSKYRWLAKHNGLAYASDVFKTVREVLLAYRADPSRHLKMSYYMSKMPLRKNGWLKTLFAYADSQPRDVFNFLKLYCGLNEPLVSVESSAAAEDSYLKSRSKVVNTATPKYLTAWLDLIRLPMLSKKAYRVFRKRLRAGEFTHCKYVLMMHEFASNSSSRPLLREFSNYGYSCLSLISKYAQWHTYSEYTEYWSAWKFRVGSLGQYRTGPNRGPAINELVTASLESAQPLPEMYVDFDINSEDVQSESLEQDLWRLHLIMNYEGGITLTPESLRVVQMGLEPETFKLMREWKSSPLKAPHIQMSKRDGLFVGQIHHIPKKGTVKRRPIAVPNRFLQMGMAPCADFLDTILRRLPHDCTFNQEKMDVKVTNRVTNDNLYVGSVDLSQATDNLPFQWGIDIWEKLYRKRLPAVLNDSWDLFTQVSRADWLNGTYLTRWDVGQPLGCLPSFRVLALTHNLFCESLAFSLGYGHSPYCILGDDLLVFTKKLRKAYIRELTNRGIPLSLHKSYDKLLVEFAGKTFIKNHLPFHTSDQSAIGYGNLFDYQRATGIAIPWSHLPKKVRRRFEKEAVKNGITNHLDIPSVYYVAQYATIGMTAHPIKNDDAKLSSYFEHMAMEDSESMPDPNLQSGIVRISNHPIKYLRTCFANKHGWKQRYREIGMPDWYKRKFRPASTDKIAKCATLAVM